MNLGVWAEMTPNQRQEWVDTLDYNTAAGLAQGLSEQMMLYVDLLDALSTGNNDRAFADFARTNLEDAITRLTQRALSLYADINL